MDIKPGNILVNIIFYKNRCQEVGFQRYAILEKQGKLAKRKFNR